MSERDEIRRLVEDFRRFQERLAAERDAPINKVNQRILHMLDEMRSHHPNPSEAPRGFGKRIGGQLSFFANCITVGQNELLWAFLMYNRPVSIAAALALFFVL